MSNQSRYYVRLNRFGFVEVSEYTYNLAKPEDRKIIICTPVVIEPLENRQMFNIWLVPPTKPFLPDNTGAFYVRGETVEIGPSVQAGQEG